MAPRQDPLGDNPAALREALDLQAAGVTVHKVWEMLKEKHGILIHERTLHRRLKRGIFEPADKRTGLAGLVSNVPLGQAVVAGSVLSVGGAASVHDAERERARVIADKLLATKKPQWGPLILGLERLRFEYLRLGSPKGGGGGLPAATRSRAMANGGCVRRLFHSSDPTWRTTTVALSPRSMASTMLASVKGPPCLSPVWSSHSLTTRALPSRSLP
jgi:hypothetical protein